jgi:hypothetical protein
MEVSERNTTDNAARPSRNRGASRLALLGWGLLLVWACWWALNLTDGLLVGGHLTWVLRWNFLGLDFYHNWLAVNHWLGGGNPYVDQFGDPLGQRWAYPPIVLWAFAWCGLLGDEAATRLWIACCAGLFAFEALACVRVRRELGLWRVPPPLAVAAVLLCTPVTFALERGQFDVVPLVLLMGAAWAVRRGARWGDVAAGLAVAIAAYLKSYPLLVLPAFFLWRRPGVVAWAVAACAVIGVAFWSGNLAALRNQASLSADVEPFPFWYGHSLNGSWTYLTKGTALGGVPGALIAAALLLPLATWVAWPIRRTAGGPRRPADERLLLPSLLFFTAVTTFALPVSSDYKLIFLVCAALCVWDVRDPWPVHALLLPLMVYLQPFQFPLGAWPLLAIKTAGLVGIGVSLAHKAERLRTPPIVTQADAPAAATTAA